MPSSTNAASAADHSVWRSWLEERIGQHFRSRFLPNATWMLCAQSLRLAGQIAYFIIVAHLLGPAGYGTFVGCTALVATMAPFASWGTGEVLIKYVARNRNVLPAYLGNALLVTVASGSLLTLFALLIRPRVLPASATGAMLTAVAIADLFGAQMTGICLNAFAALEQFRRYTQLSAWSTGVRLIAALVLAASAATPLRWAYLYAASAVIAAITGLAAVSRCCASPHFQPDLLLPSVREGFHFSTSTASQSVYNDIDKTMLARLSTVESAAIYAVAYRFIDAAMLPIRSVAAATYPEFFRRGTHGVTPTFGFARSILRRSVVYGIGTTIALFLTAGLVPLILGQAYAESTTALRWLCLLPAIKGVQAFLSDTLTGANYQWQRSVSQVAVAAFNILVNLWIIRAYAWRGAAWSSLMTDSLLMVMLYLIISRHLRRERVAAGAATTAQPIVAAATRSPEAPFIAQVENI
jgi:O-antigen/teichoic acid export membrane protein